MTLPEETLSRPEFEIVDRSIGAAIKGLVASDAEYARKYRTMGGMLVAVVAPRSADSDDSKAALAYRTAPPSESATRKASKVFEAVRAHAVDE